MRIDVFSHLLAMFWGAIAAATIGGSIDGRVVDDDLRGIGDAEVHVLGTPVELKTSADGRFRITDMRPGPYVVTVRKIGFQPLALIVTVTEGDTARLNFTLERMAVGLDTVRVTAEYQSQRLNEVARRKAAGLGNYITAADLEKYHTFDLGNALRRLPGIFVTYDDKNGTTSIQSGRSFGFLTACSLRVFVDEVPMPAGIDIAMLPNINEIVAIEVYKSSNTVPAQYRNQAGCGAVLIWTKTGR